MMDILTVALLLSALLLTRITVLRTAVHVLTAQSLFVALACIAVGLGNGGLHTYIAAGLTLLIKGGVIPYTLHGVVRRLRRETESNPLLSANYSSLIAAGCVALTYAAFDRTLPGTLTRDTLAASFALVLIALLLIVTRRQAVMQIIGLITLENGLYLLGLSITGGLPLIIELGIFLDVLLAAVILIILTYRLKLSFASTDTSALKKLRG